MNTLLAVLIAAGPYGVGVGLHPDAATVLGIDVVPDFGEVARLGADTVLLPVPWSQRDAAAFTIRRTDQSIHDADLIRAIVAAHHEKLDVVLMPFVTLEHGADDDWRGRLRPTDESAWWRSYHAFVLHYAAIAAAHDVSTFVVGSELTSLQDRSKRWAALVSKVRERYSGTLAYVSNHDALDRTAVFDHVDVAGVSAYFPLAAGVDASSDELAAAWIGIVEILRVFKARVDRPVTVFEIGYPSIDGAAMVPWDDTIGAPIDLEEQRRLYRAASDALFAAPQVDGVLFWGWFGHGGIHDRSYTPRGKPAERELRRLFRRVHEKNVKQFDARFRLIGSGDYCHDDRPKQRTHRTMGTVRRAPK